MIRLRKLTYGAWSTNGKKPPMTESEFQRMVIEYAKLRKWRVAHFRGVCVQRKNGTTRYQTPVQADGAGFVDLVLVRDRVIYAELKSETGRLSVDQEAWEAVLKRAGQEYYLWKPSDWQKIERVLR